MSIAWRIRLLAIGLVVVTSASVGLVVYWGYNALVSRQQAQDLEHMFRVEVAKLRYAFAEAEHDVHVLANLPSVREIIDARRSQTPPEASAQALWESQLTSVFTVMLNVNEHYTHVRLIGVDDGGREIVRVDKTPEGGIQRGGKSQLQQQGDRSYFKEAIEVPPGGVYFSEINLNRQRSDEQTPYQPVLRVAAPVYEVGGKVFGVVIINLAFDEYIKSLYMSDTRDVTTHYLTNEEGDFLLHPDSTKTYGFDLGQRHRVVDEFAGFAPMFDPRNKDPFAGMTLRLKGAEGGGDRLVRFERVPVDVFGTGRTYYMGLSVLHSDMLADTSAVAAQALMFTGLLVLAALAAGYLLSSWMIRPLEKITAAANQIAAGWVVPKLPTNRRDEIGKLAGAFGQMVHALHDNEQNLQEVNRKLLRANADLEHFAHIASHDLREPARRVAGLADLLSVREQDHLSPGGRELISRIQNASVIMLDQITDFREMANIGQGVMLRRRVRLDELISQVLDEFSKQLALRDVTVDLAELPQVRVYESLVVVLYRNLILNAMQHGKDHGIELTFPKERNGSGWVFGVRNSGSHIDPEQLEKIFAPFARGARGTGRSGMGLSICKRIIDRHAGTIWAESIDDEVVIKFTFGKDADVDQDRD